MPIFSRTSDTWSFGCTLLEDVVYIERGKVEERVSKKLVYLDLAFGYLGMAPIALSCSTHMDEGSW